MGTDLGRSQVFSLGTGVGKPGGFNLGALAWPRPGTYVGRSGGVGLAWGLTLAGLGVVAQPGLGDLRWRVWGWSPSPVWGTYVG
eukprot:13267771-Alexandrium_andersonii.AAC.1